MPRFCRFDVVGLADRHPLRDGTLTVGDGSVTHGLWMPVESQSLVYVVHARIAHYAWTEVSFRFTRDVSGRVDWQLSGPWELADSNTLFRQTVLWERPRVRNGRLLTDLRTHVETRHGEPFHLAVEARAGQPVTLSVRARAAPPPDFVDMARVPGSDTPAHRAQSIFRRGVSLSNCLEAPPGDDWGMQYDPADFVRIRAEGFDHVRIPIAWHHYTGPPPEHLLATQLVAKVDRLVALGTASRLGVVLNLQHFDAFMDDPKGQTPKFLAVWEQIARHYAGAPPSVAFELLNEPNSNATTAVVGPIYEEAIRSIRRSCTQRTIFVGPGNWNSVYDLDDLRLPAWDRNLVVTLHCYEPFLFTHQGTSWTAPMTATTNILYPGPPRGAVEPDAACTNLPYVVDWLARYNLYPAETNPSNRRHVRLQMERARVWSAYYGRPIHVGEFGCYRQVDPASRVSHLYDTRNAIEDAGFGWAMWDWKSSFGYWDSTGCRPLPGLRQALFGRTHP
jgi:endoglucanase